jgi:hypothetical protein
MKQKVYSKKLGNAKQMFAHIIGCCSELMGKIIVLDNKCRHTFAD